MQQPQTPSIPTSITPSPTTSTPAPSTLIDMDVLYKIQYGLYIITTKSGSLCNGQIATTVFQVTSDPAQLAICLSKKTYTHELMRQNTVVGISILEQETPLKFIGQFGFKCGKNCDKFNGIEHRLGTLIDCPLVITHSLATIECSLSPQQPPIDLGSHTLFIATIQNTQKIKDGAALTYEYYHNVIKGKSPENAPTYHSNH
jgi:ferric-chelate reductase [NAD(P)H]